MDTSLENQFKFALVKGGLVVNTVIFDSETPDENLIESLKKDLLIDEIISIQAYGPARMGDSWDGTKFFSVDLNEPPAPNPDGNF